MPTALTSSRSTRPSLQALPSSSSSRVRTHTGQPTHNLYPLFASLTFHIVNSKLENDVPVLYNCIEDLGGKCVGVEGAKIVVTALKGRARLGKVLGREWVDSKPILSPEYIYDTFQTALDIANAQDENLIPHLAPRDKYYVFPPNPSGPNAKAKAEPHFLSDSDDDAERTGNGDGDGDGNVFGGRSAKRRRLDLGSSSSGIKGYSEDELPDMEMYPEDVVLEDIPKYCVERPSPLKCINQDIIDAIKPIYESRLFEERGQMNSNVLSYRRSMSVIKCLPRRLKSGKEAMRLLDVGERVGTRIDEFLSTGTIAESEEILASPRFAALQDFASVFTIGHATAKILYDKFNCRTLEDVKTHYEAIAEESPEIREKEKMRRRKEGGMTHVDIVDVWMGLKDELDQKIPRSEVEEIAECVSEHLEAIMPGCSYTLTGGYRRGKAQSSDVDIVFCPPHHGDDNGLLRDLTRRMGQMGIITHVLQVMDRQPNMPISAAANNFDNLDKAFVIFKLPGKGRLHRRVDLISAPKERYAAGVLSWSGSMMFERDLKRFAEDQGLKFRAGIVEANTGREINLATEREIFHYLGLRYVPPELRNADG